MAVASVEFKAVVQSEPGRRRTCLASTSALAILASAAWAGFAEAQCVGPDSNNVVNCAPGSYGSIFYTSNNPGLTINIPAGVTVTTFGVVVNGGSAGSGTIVVNADPSDSFTSTNNGAGFDANTQAGDISLTGGNVTETFSGASAVVANDAQGNVSIDVQTATSNGGTGIFVGGAYNAGILSGAPGNVTIKDVGASGASGITVQNASGAISINSGNTTGANGAGIIALTNGGPIKVVSGNASASAGSNPTWAVLAIGSGDANITSGFATATGGFSANITAGTELASNALVGMSGQGNVSITSGSASVKTFIPGQSSGGGDAIYGQALNGTVTINSGNVAASGNGAFGIDALAGGDIKITSGNVTTDSGGLFNEPGGVIDLGGPAPATYPAGNYAANGVFAQSLSGNVTITASSVSAPGPGADGIIADAALNIGITVSGNVSANQMGLELSTTKSAGQTTITVQPGAIVSGGFVGVDLSGSNAGVNGAALGSDLGAINLTNNGSISGGNGGFGVMLGASNGPTTITNTGTISGGAFGVAVHNIANFTSPLTITNPGAISGGFSAIDVTMNGNPLVINGGGTFTGSQFGILAFDDTGPITISAGNVTPTAQAGIIAETTSGNVTINVARTTTTGSFGIFGQSTSGAVNVTSGNATATDTTAGQIANAVVGIAGGDVTIISGNASAAGGFSANITAGTESASGALVGMSGQGNVSITSASASATTTGGGEAIYGQALNGTVTITSGNGSASGDGDAGIRTLAGGDIKITSGNITTSGGQFNEPGGNIDAGGPARTTYPAGAYSADGIDAQSLNGNVTIIAGNISAPGSSANGIVADAAGTNTITVTGNVSAQRTGISLASAGPSTVTVEAGAIVSGGAFGIEAEVTFPNGLAVADQGGLNIIDDGTIAGRTGPLGAAIVFTGGPNSLTLGTGWAINGQIIGGTNNALILAGSIATPTASQDAPSFTDFSSLEVKTGYWTLPNAASYATTVVDPAGALEIDTSLAGNLTDNGEVVFNTPGDVGFGGAFSGNGELVKDGPGVLTFAGLYSFSGMTLINAGAIDIANLAANATLNVSGGTLNVSGNSTITALSGTGGTVNVTGNATVGSLNGSSTVTVSTGETVSVGSGSYAGNMSGGGSLAKTGNGTLTLAGNDHLGGNVTVVAGALSVTGNLASPQLAVDSGASLGGNGTISGCVTVEPGGIFSPGDPVTTTILGNLLFAKGSMYLAQVTAAGAHDLIAVKGNVTIARGATFEAKPLGSISGYHLLSGYTVISATGTLSGTFSKVTSSMPLLTPFLVYTRHDVDMLLVRNDKSFASQAVTPNQAAAAAAIEAGGSDSSLYMALVGQTALGLQTGYGALAGEGYADVGSVMLEQSDQTRRSLIGRMDAPNPSQGLWVATYGDTGAADAGAAFAHARTALGESASGLDVTFAGWRVGLATGVGYDSLSISTRGASTIDSFWTTSAYAAYDSGPFDVRFGATYGWHRLASARDVAFPGFADANRSLSHVSSGEAFGEVGWTWRSERGWIEPFAGVSIDTVGGFALTEAGGVSALNVATQDRTVLAARVGVQGEVSVFGHLTLHGAIAWRHASGDVVGAAHVSFEGTGEGFNVHGLPIAANAAEITAGLSGKVDQRTTLDLSYHGEAGDHFSDNAVKLKAAWSF